MQNHSQIHGRNALSLTGLITAKSSDSDLSPGEILDILGNERRRYAVAVLAENYGLIDFRELVESVAVLESGGQEENVDRSRRKSIKNSLYQTHLPKLERAGIIETTRKSGMIRAAEQAKQVFNQLEFVCSSIPLAPA